MDGCLNAVRNGTAAVLLLDADASQGTAEKYESACRAHHVPLVKLPAGLLGDATGRTGVAAAVNQGGFAEQILSLTAKTVGENETQVTTKMENHIGGASVE